jgi:hypothetical protein
VRPSAGAGVYQPAIRSGGKFAYGARSSVFESITALGGVPADTAPTRATNYVVIGAFAIRDWVNTSHGRKLKKRWSYAARERGCVSSRKNTGGNLYASQLVISR